MAVILVVDDDAEVLDLVCVALRRDGHEAVAATTGHSALVMCRRVRPALALVDLKLPDLRLDGLGFFRVLHAEFPELIGIMMTAWGTIQNAFESGQAGMVKYIEKPFRMDALVATVDAALATRPAGSDSTLRATPGTSPDAFDDMIGSCPPMRELFEHIVKVAALNQPVLILGETGTGKELVARSIHRRSRRSRGPFVDVNCSAIPTPLFEAEFFGHERGAFTDARESRAGFFEQAHDGTLFLDEVGDLTLEAQAKLLRVIEQRQVTRLGGRRAITIDVRVLAATNIDLDQAVTRGTFRADLYWRLNVLCLRCPSVRDRGEDRVLLIDHLLQRIRGEVGNSRVELSAEARQALLTHHWPGNVREIDHTLRQALMAAKGAVVEVTDLPAAVTTAHVDLRPEDHVLPEGLTLSQAFTAIRTPLERAWIEQALTEAHGNRSQAALRLGVDSRTLYSKMRRYGIRNLET